MNPQLSSPDGQHEQHTLDVTSESQDTSLEGNNNPGKSDPPKPEEAEDDILSDDETSQSGNDEAELSQSRHAPPGWVDENFILTKANLWDYQTQLMVLEQQNKRRLMIARLEQENLGGRATQPAQGQTQGQMLQTLKIMAITDGERTGGSSPNTVGTDPRQPSCPFINLDYVPERQEQRIRSRL